MATRRPRIVRVRAGHSEAAAQAAADVLAVGGLVLIPTDTVYGIAAHPAFPDAVAAIYAAKARDAGKPIPILAADLAAVESVGARLGVVERRLAESFWPGSLTLVLRVGSVTEGFRVPDDVFVRLLLQKVGGALRVTSANRSGGEPACTAQEAVQALGAHVQLVIDGGRTPIGVASTVVRVEGRRVHVLREGALDASRLRDAARGRRHA